MFKIGKLSQENDVTLSDTINQKFNNNSDKLIEKLKNRAKNTIDAKFPKEELLVKVEIEDFDEELPPCDENAATKNCNSAIPIIGDIIGNIVDIFDGDTKDGQIGETKQGATGDCWILSAINALNYTDEGKKIIKDALEYHDGYTIVRLKGVGTYQITDAELNRTKGSSHYSSGDDDMIILELAMEKALDEIAKGNLRIDADCYGLNEREKTSIGKSSTDGGYIATAIYMITGKMGNYAYGDDMDSALNDFQKNGCKDMAIGASTGGCADKKIKDINGKEINISGNHAYAIKEVTDDTVTFTNPWDSGDEIVVSRETFMETFISVQYCDLSDKNPEQYRIMRPTIDISTGNKIFERDCSKDYFIDSKGNQAGYTTEKTIYSPDGNLLETTYYDKDGHKKLSKKYDEKTGNLAEVIEYNENGTIGLSKQYDENGNESYRLCEYNKDGTSDYSIYIKSNTTAENIYSRNLFEYKQFTIDEIDIMANLSDDDWTLALEMLNKNPETSCSDILKHIFCKKIISI